MGSGDRAGEMIMIKICFRFILTSRIQSFQKRGRCEGGVEHEDAVMSSSLRSRGISESLLVME